MWARLMLRVSFSTHSFVDLGLGERSLRAAAATACGAGEADDRVRRERRYRLRDLDREVLLPLLLLLLLLLLEDEADLGFGFAVDDEGGEVFFCGFEEESAAGLSPGPGLLLRALPLLEALLLRDELPEELERLEPEELEREPELERLELLLPEDELQKEKGFFKKGGDIYLTRTTTLSCSCFFAPPSAPPPRPLVVPAPVSRPPTGRRATPVPVSPPVPVPVSVSTPASATIPDTPGFFFSQSKKKKS